MLKTRDIPTLTNPSPPSHQRRFQSPLSARLLPAFELGESAFRFRRVIARLLHPSFIPVPNRTSMCERIKSFQEVEKSIRGEPVESCKLSCFNSFEFFDYTEGQSDRVPPLQTIMFSSFTGRTPACRDPSGSMVLSFYPLLFPTIALVTVSRKPTGYCFSSGLPYGQPFGNFQWLFTQNVHGPSLRDRKPALPFFGSV